MKVLAAACLHKDISLVQRLADRAVKEDVDAIILAGDFSGHAGDMEGVLGPFSRTGKKVFLVPGNHDNPVDISVLSDIYKLVNIHGYAVEHYDFGIFGHSAVNCGMFSMPEHEVLDVLKKSFKYVKHKNKKIMVTHIHPSGTQIEKFSNFVVGSDAVRRAIEDLQPDIAISGHVHEAEGIEEKIGKTRVINVCRQGKIIEI